MLKVIALLALVTAVATSSGGAAGTKDPALRQALSFIHRGGCAYAPATSMWMRDWNFNALSGPCRSADGYDQRAWFFVRGRFVGNDAPTPSREVIGLWRDGNTIAFLYVLYRRWDANCCPTGGGKVVRFRWNGHQVVRLDRLPPSQLGATALGR